MLWRASLAAAFFATASRAQPSITGAPTWSLIPTWRNAPSSLDSPPVGCTCVDSSSPCTKYDCACTCDLRAGECDANCCCDSECTPAEVSRFRALSACLPEGPGNRTLRACLDVDAARALVAVNPAPRMRVDTSAALDGVLCITVDNSPLKGTYVADPGAQSPDALSRPAVARASSFKTQTRAPPPAPGARYDVGGTLPAATLAAGGAALRSVSGGALALPAGAGGGGGGACALADGGVYARFRLDRPPSTCVATALLDAAGQGCEALASPARLAASLLVGRTPAAAPAGGAAGYVAVAVNSVLALTAATGALAPVAPSALGAGAWNATACACAGVPTALTYVVTYDAASQAVTGVSVDAVVTTVAQAPAACGAAPVAVPLSTAVTFVPAALAGGGYAANAAAVYGRSGAPGYALGAPLLGGALVAQSGANPAAAALADGDRTAIATGLPPGQAAPFARVVETGALGGLALAGLRLRGPGPDGACAGAGAAPGADAAGGGVPVLFGTDMTLSCALRLDRPALQALCSTAGGAGVLAYIGALPVNASWVPGGAAAVTHVGTLGNADPWKAWQWTPLSASAPAPAAAWDGVRSCANVVAGVDVEVLWARVGEASNPQRRVLAARVSYPTDTWTYAREDVLAAAAPATGATGQQTFLLRTTVTFTEWPAPAGADYVPPAPPIIPLMPSDLWYPFQTAAGDSVVAASGAGGGRRAGAGAAAGAAAAVAAVMALAAGRRAHE